MTKNVKALNKDSLPPESGTRRKNSRTKGHNYERWLAKFFREQFNYNFCKTSREASRMLDDCGVDLSGVPYNIQAKSGYKGHRPKPDLIFANMTEKLSKNFPEEDPIHKKLKLVFHKLDGHKPENHLVTLQFCDFIEILKVYEKYKEDGKQPDPVPVCDIQIL